MMKISSTRFHATLLLCTITFAYAESPLDEKLHESSPYLPVVLIAGINSDWTDMQPTEDLINKYMPGVYVKNVHLGLGRLTSFWNMYDQAALLAKELYEDYNLRNGCNIIAHSQGGLTARYVIQRYNHPHVYNLITWGTPHRGICGTPSTIDNKYMWLDFIEPYASYVFYMPIFQECISFAGYWNDTVHYNDYLQKCCFLPYLNNEIKHEFNAIFKENLLTLHNFVMVKSTQEEIVEPDVSCHFGYYLRGSVTATETLQESDVYKNDVLGLQVLDTTGRLHFKYANCPHFEYESNEENFVNNTLPFLTLDVHGNQISTVSIENDQVEIQPVDNQAAFAQQTEEPTQETEVTSNQEVPIEVVAA